MATKQQTTAAPLPEPQAGGSYVRNADGSLTLVSGSQTEPVQGRAEASRKALEERMGSADSAPAPVAAAATFNNSKE